MKRACKMMVEIIIYNYSHLQFLAYTCTDMYTPHTLHTPLLSHTTQSHPHTLHTSTLSCKLTHTLYKLLNTLTCYTPSPSLSHYTPSHSWGPNWGVWGFGMLARNKNNHCGIATSPSLPTLQTLATVQHKLYSVITTVLATRANNYCSCIIVGVINCECQLEKTM